MSKKETAVAIVTRDKKEIKKADRRMAWGGVMPQVGKSETDNRAISAFCNQVAVVYGVPSMGVNAMSGQPYLNKDGRLYLLSELRRGKTAVKAIRKEFVQMSHNIDEPAVVKATIVFADGVEIEAIGEASKQSVKLDAVKQTLNMMAETRAVNRAIWQAVAHDVWDRVSKNLATSKGMSDEEKNRVVEAGRVSYEEMQQPKASEASSFPTTEEELIENLKGKIDDIEDVGTLIDHDEKLQKGKSSPRVKKEVGDYIKAKAAKLGA